MHWGTGAGARWGVEEGRALLSILFHAGGGRGSMRGTLGRTRGASGRAPEVGCPSTRYVHFFLSFSLFPIFYFLLDGNLGRC
jgi:hypothetical protein